MSDLGLLPTGRDAPAVPKGPPQSPAVYESPPVGKGVSVVFHGVSPDLLDDHQHLIAILRENLEAEHFTILGLIERRFEPRGSSALALLAESHAGFHTYPEHGSVHIFISSCRGPDDGKIFISHFRAQLNPVSTKTHGYKIVVKP